MHDKINLYDLDFDQLTSFVEDKLGEKKYRAKQIWEWMYTAFVTEFDQMTNLSKGLRLKLAQLATLGVLDVALMQHSNDKQTTKYLFRLADGQLIETVLMYYDNRITACISTQAGCAMGCVFCATGQMGFFRNLSSGEIVEQVVYLNQCLKEFGHRLTNVVMMGMGEPLHNYANTIAALDRITDADGINLGARKVTISTVGLIPAIRRYADEQRQTPLAISLHAATDLERSALLPINKRWSIGDLIDACHYYLDKTGRRLTFEWALISGENDTLEQATALGQLLEGMLCHVNLIPLNPTGGFSGGPSSRERTEAFCDRLAEYGVSSTVRVRRGIDIQAGCGQLRDRLLEHQLVEEGTKITFSAETSIPLPTKPNTPDQHRYQI